MPVTAIKSIRNGTGVGCYVRNLENPNDTDRNGQPHALAPGEVWQCNMWIPWADTQDQFDHGSGIGKGPAHINITFVWSSLEDAPPPHEFAIWQSGDYVRYSKNLSWVNNGQLVPGNSTVGGDRSVDIVGTDGQDADVNFY